MSKAVEHFLEVEAHLAHLSEGVDVTDADREAKLEDALARFGGDVEGHLRVASAHLHAIEPLEEPVPAEATEESDEAPKGRRRRPRSVPAEATEESDESDAESSTD